MAVDEPAVAEREHLHRCRLAARGEADDVDRADRPLVGRLPLGQVADRLEPVAVARGLLEVLALGRGVHLLLELA